MKYNIQEFYDIGKVHDWRNYISDELKLMWLDFTDEQRQAIKDNADSIAADEEWD